MEKEGKRKKRRKRKLNYSSSLEKFRSSRSNDNDSNPTFENALVAPSGWIVEGPGAASPGVRTELEVVLDAVDGSWVIYPRERSVK